MTEGAAAKNELPGWLAVIEQMPAAMRVTLTPETAQICVLLEANVTTSPELAVALKAKDPVSSVRLLSAVNVIVCGLGGGVTVVIVKVCVTGPAGAYVALPA